MPRIALVVLGLVGACSFEADYSGGMYYCSDGKCPSGLTCRTDLSPPECREARKDAAIDTPPIGDAIDARLAALTCNDPGILPMTGDTVMGTTANRPLGNSISVSCNGSNMLGFDAVYKLDNVGAGKQVTLTINTTGATWQGAAAYIIQPCATGGTCIGTNYAQPGAPVNITTIASGPPFVVVDSTLSGTSGGYVLNVSVN